MQIMNNAVARPRVDESTGSAPPDRCRLSSQPSYVKTAAEALKNYRENPAAVWYKHSADPADSTGKYAFQRLRQPSWFVLRSFTTACM